jgi:hypothetical protein
MMLELYAAAMLELLFHSLDGFRVVAITAEWHLSTFVTVQGLYK